MSYWKFKAAQRAAARDKRFRERTVRHMRAEAGCIAGLLWRLLRLPLGLVLIVAGAAVRLATYRPTGFKRRPSALIRAGTRMLLR